MMKKLLLADDSITIQKVVGIIFSTEEYQLEVTDDGDRAFTKALEDIPDLVIADISMPGKDGFELCRAIKNEPSLANTSVLLLPGAFDHFDETKASEVCADGWLTKPFESQALLDKVSQLLEAEPVRMAGVVPSGSEELPVETQSGTAEIATDTGVNEEVLGLDAVDELAPSTEEAEEESPDDIWDTVSFAEEDLQEQSEPASADSDVEVSFAADVIDPSAVDEVGIEPATDEQVLSAFTTEEDEPVAEVESVVVEETSDLSEAEPFQPEPVEGVELGSDEEVTELGDQDESASEVVSPAPLEEAEVVDFSVYSEEDDLKPPAADLDDGEDLTYFSSPDEDEEREEEEPLELVAGDLAEQSTDVEVAAEEPASFVMADEEAIVELQEEDEPVDLEPVISAPTDLGESAPEFADAPVEDISDDDEVFDLSEEDIVEPEPLEDVAGEIAAVEIETVDALEPESLGSVSAPVEEELEPAEELEPTLIDNEDENFYFDATMEDDSDVAAVTAGAVGVAAGVAAVQLGSAEVGSSATEQVEQQLRTLSENELQEVVSKVAGPMIEKMAGEMLEKIAWEVVPDLAEAMISEEIRKIKEGG